MSQPLSGKNCDERSGTHLSPRACRRAIASARSIRLQVRTRMEASCHICLEGGGDIVRACDTCTAHVHPACQQGWQRHLSPRDERRYRCSVCRTFFRQRPASPPPVATSPAAAARRRRSSPDSPRVSRGTLRRVLLCALLVNMLALSGFAIVHMYWARTAAATMQRLFMTHIWLSYNCVAVSVSSAMSLCAMHLLRCHTLPLVATLCVLLVLSAVGFVMVDLPTSFIAYFLTLFVFLAIFVRFFHAEPPRP